MAKRLKIGLFGFGCVGQGLYHVLNNSTGFKADIAKICVKDKNKTRNVKADLITYDKWEILNDPRIDIVIELIDDATEAFNIVSEALQSGKNVVTANKKMLAVHLSELYDLQRKHNVSLLYEGSACGSIPIIRTLEEYFDNEEILNVSGIFNGTTNYILTKTINEKLSYAEALLEAQQKGFAESDPTNDVEGYDAKYKAIIIALHAFGLIIPENEVFNLGITGLGNEDVKYALEKNYKIKLIPVIQRLKNNEVCAFVLPKFVKADSPLYNVENEFNGVQLQGKFSGQQFLQGRGAGSYPTGAAVLSDVSALSYGYTYEYKKLHQQHPVGFTNNVIIDVYLRYAKEEDLNQLQFEQIKEKFTGDNYNYVTGKIRLQALITNKDFLIRNKIFVALINDEVQLAELEIKKEKKSLYLSELI
ncbi:MAG: homoserine dehydrogenase [Sphingobacteriaceae bacterium]|nr:homoserine dehydrogenase [Sphingobacteriaceae bacterium]